MKARQNQRYTELFDSKHKEALQNTVLDSLEKIRFPETNEIIKEQQSARRNANNMEARISNAGSVHYFVMILIFQPFTLQTHFKVAIVFNCELLYNGCKQPYKFVRSYFFLFYKQVYKFIYKFSILIFKGRLF